MRRRYCNNDILDPGNLKLYTKRFYPSGNYTWVVPNGCTQVDVFLVGGGGGGGNAGGGGGYTKTFKQASDGWKDGDAIPVTPGESISIVVGKGGTAGAQQGGVSFSTPGGEGGFSQFKNASYRANGGKGGKGYYTNGSYGGDGGSGGGAYRPGGSDGNNGEAAPDADGIYYGGIGQGHTTRDFGESSGNRNAGGGGGASSGGFQSGGVSDYDIGGGSIGEDNNSTGGSGGAGGGYGGGGGAAREPSPNHLNFAGEGGDGTVLIRYYAY